MLTLQEEGGSELVPRGVVLLQCLGPSPLYVAGEGEAEGQHGTTQRHCKYPCSHAFDSCAGPVGSLWRFHGIEGLLHREREDSEVCSREHHTYIHTYNLLTEMMPWTKYTGEPPHRTKPEAWEASSSCELI